MRTNQVKRSIDANLDGLRVTARKRAQIMHSIEEGTVVKRKVTVALVLTIVLLLATSALAAAILSSKDFVGNVLAPKASRDGLDMWTKTEVEEILRVAAENGIQLSDDVLARVRGADGQYKEELMRIFTKVDLGFYPSTWSIEDQAWYDQLLVDCGLNEQRTRFLPEAGEISQEEALTAAIQYIHEQYDKEANVTDEVLYRRHVQYVLASEAGAKKWDIEYIAQNLERDSYVVTLTPAGDIIEGWVMPGVRLEGANITSPQDIMDRYQEIYGAAFFWEPETWVAFHAAVEKASTVHVVQGKMMACILQQAYGIPDSASLPKNEAIHRAVITLTERGIASAEELAEAQAFAVYLLDGDMAVWKVTVPNASGIQHLLEMDAHTGEVRWLGAWQPGSSDVWYRRVVLESVVAGEPPHATLAPGMLTPASDTVYRQALENAKADKRPAIWGSKAAPNFFWEKMTLLGFTADTAEGMINQWIASYGADVRFWPLEQQAIVHLWGAEQSADETILRGLPAQNHIQQAQAETIAREAYKTAYRQAYGEDVPSRFILFVSFVYNGVKAGDSAWNIEVIDPTRTTGQGCGWMAIDAKTGEVLVIDAAIGSNG